jgi:hypothetical protein
MGGVVCEPEKRAKLGRNFTGFAEGHPHSMTREGESFSLQKLQLTGTRH